MPPPPFQAFTIKFSGRADRIITDLTVAAAFDPALPPDPLPTHIATKARTWTTISEVRGIKNLDAGVTAEVVSVERENVRDSVDVHRRHEARVMGFLAGDTVCHDEPTPLRIDLIRVGQSKNRALDTSENSVSLGRSEAESVALDGPRADCPQLDEILRGHADAIALFAEPGNRLASFSVLWVGALEPTEDNVRVGENVH
jgi:Fe2+ transport system protein FeoA